MQEGREGRAERVDDTPEGAGGAEDVAAWVPLADEGAWCMSGGRRRGNIEGTPNEHDSSPLTSLLVTSLLVTSSHIDPMAAVAAGVSPPAHSRRDADQSTLPLASVAAVPKLG